MSFLTFKILRNKLNGLISQYSTNKLVLEKVHNIFKEIYRGINRKFKEPEVFAGGFFGYKKKIKIVFGTKK